MEWRLFLLFLFTGVHSQLFYRRYHLIQQGETWANAQAYCKTYYTDLATIRGNNDLVRIQAEGQKQLLSSNTWIGLYVNVNTWQWSLGTQPVTGVSYWPSAYGEPSNTGGVEECATMSGYGWWDLDCSRLFPFLCFDERNTGSAGYILYSTPLSWHDAQSYCRQYHTDLASTRDEVEYSFVLAKGIYPFFWIGLFRDSWKWVDNSTSNINWISGKPDNILGNQFCGGLNVLGQSFDCPCGTVMPFYCYRSIIGRLHIGFKVQSYQDVNDPTVLAALVQRIKEKLKNHGLEKDVFVQWRTQPNGNVFKIQ